MTTKWGVWRIADGEHHIAHLRSPPPKFKKLLGVVETEMPDDLAEANRLSGRYLYGRADYGFIYGRWYVGWRGFSIAWVLRDWKEWGYQKDWYDGPLYFFGLGPVQFTYVP